MAWRANRVNVLSVIDIPDDIPVGVVIGRGGCQSKRIAATHRVRCKVEFDIRKVFIEGSRHGVDRATGDIQELFDQARAVRERESARRHDDLGLPATTSTIHTIAVAKHSEDSAWRFERREHASVDTDPNVKDFAYRLVVIPSASDVCGKEDQVDHDPLGWVSTFDTNFLRRMADQLSGISTENPSLIKLKLAFGLQCFALPDAAVASGKLYSWDELRALKLYAHVKPRWSNMLNNSSEALTSLMNELEEQFGESTTFNTELVVYVDKRHGHRGDISIKFRWEYGEWVLVERKPVRVAHALYNIALDNETAFRVRVYSRQDATPSLDYEELVGGLKIVTALDRDPFSTTVTTHQGFPDGLFLRSFAVHETATVEARGLEFTISYLDAQRKTATLACQLPENDGANPTKAIVSLVEKALLVLAKPLSSLFSV